MLINYHRGALLNSQSAQRGMPIQPAPPEPFQIQRAPRRRLARTNKPIKSNQREKYEDEWDGIYHHRGPTPSRTTNGSIDKPLSSLDLQI